MKYRTKFFFMVCVFIQIISIHLPSHAQIVEEAWVARYSGGINNIANAIAVDDSGNVYVTGQSFETATSWDYATIKYNSIGIEQWSARYNGPANGQDMAHAIALDDSGNVYVTGRSPGTGTGNDYATIKYDASGTELWVARYNGPGNLIDVASAIAVDDSSNVYVTGWSRGSGTGNDYATIKYNSAGVEQWVARYNGLGNAADLAYAIAVDNSGNVYVTGESNVAFLNTDYATIKYNSSGVEQWVSLYNGPGNSFDNATAIAVDDSGNVYVTGSSSGSGTGVDYATVKYNSSGTELWVSRFNGPGNNEDAAYSLAIDGSGNVFVTGYTAGPGVDIYAYATVKYDNGGSEEWVAYYNGIFSYEGAYDIAVDVSGNVYVTGVSTDSAYAYYDYATIKYTTTGLEEWVIRYNGPANGNDEAFAIAVDNFGNVYVTGQSQGDYATIKYIQTPTGVEPTAPSNLAAIADTFYVNLTWDDNSNNELGFKIERKDDSLHIPSQWILIDSVAANVTAYVDTGLTPNTTYTYRVYAYNEFGNSAYSDSVEATTIIPVELTSFTATITNNKVTINWATATETNNLGFEIHRKAGNKQSAADNWETLGFAQGHGTTTEPKSYSFIDDNVISGKYLYRLKQIDYDGSFNYSNMIEVEVDFTPKEYTLFQNYPNPFNPTTTIKYALPFDSNVRVEIFNVLGEKVAELVNAVQQSGYHDVVWNAGSNASNIYFYSIQAQSADGQKEFKSSKKMMLIK